MDSTSLFSGNFNQKKKALYLDRDGVLIRDMHYLKDPSQVVIENGAIDLLRAANHAGWLVIIVTNQSGIYRGYFDWNDYNKVTERMLELLGDKKLISAIYANSLGPDAPITSWRKPSPVMLQRAAEYFNIDLPNSILIGDRLTDLQAGTMAGLEMVMHILSGHGAKERSKIVSNIDSDGHFVCGLNKSNYYMLNTLNDFPVEMLLCQS